MHRYAFTIGIWAWKRTTIGRDRPVPAPDLIGRDFTAAAPDARWCGGVTYIKTWDGWAYLATVIDLYSRKVIGWAVAAHFFATYKKELIHTRPWPTLANLEKETSDWIGNYYNLVRRHSALGYLTPGEYELGYRQLSQLAA
jgi:transposase InsO family protein